MSAEKTEKRQSAREIDIAAAAWAARADRGLTSDEAVALSGWVDGDPRRKGAYARALAVSLRARRAAALGPAYRPDDFAAPRRGLSRRRLVAAGGGALAAGVAAGVAAVFWNDRFSTRLGEVRVIPLRDGSVVTLNTRSTIVVAYSTHQRLVRLISGEALFDVAKDSARPFLVSAGPALVRAVGTSFTVSRLSAAPVEVAVLEGVVEVGDTVRRGPFVLRLGARERASVTRASIVPGAVSGADLDRRLSWTDGRLSFGGETLEQAAAEYARYSDVKIVIDDPSLGARPVVGLFETNDPVGFARAVGTAFNARVEVGDGEIHISP